MTRMFEFDLHVSNDTGDQLFGTVGFDSLDGSMQGDYKFSVSDNRGLSGDLIFSSDLMFGGNSQ